MGLLDSVRGAVGRVADTVRQVEKKVEAKVQQVEAKVESKVEQAATRVREEVSGKVSSFQAAVKSLPVTLKPADLRAQVIITADKSKVDTDALTTQAKTDPGGAGAAILEALNKAEKKDDDDDVAQDVVNGLSDDELKAMAASPKGREALDKMKTALDSGWTTGSLTHSDKSEWACKQRIDKALASTPAPDVADANAKANGLDPNPATSLLPKENKGQAGASTPLTATQQGQLEEVDLHVANASATARGTPEQVKQLVDDSISKAKGLEPRAGGDLIARTADKLVAAGKFDEAKRLVSELKTDRYAKVDVDLMARKSGGAAQITTDNQNQIFLNQREGIASTLGSVADTKLKQIALTEDMSVKLKKSPANPYDLNQVKDYLSMVKKESGMQGAAAKYGQYLDAFAHHPGGERYRWFQDRNDLGDPTKFTAVLAKEPRDASGRMMLDCEGHTFLTKAVFGADNNVVITSDNSHIAASVFDKKTGEGFQVNTLDGKRVFSLNDKQAPARTAQQQNDRAWTQFQLLKSDGTRKEQPKKDLTAPTGPPFYTGPSLSDADPIPTTRD